MPSDKPLKPLPYYQWYWQDFRANRTVQRMTYVERGLYRDLLDECWVEGGIPDDIESLADICGCPVDIMASAWQVLSRCFALVNGRLTNAKMDSVRTEKDRQRLNKAESGRLGGAAKSLKENDSVADASKCLANPSGCHIEEKSREENITPLTPQGGGEPSATKKRTKREESTLTDWLTALPEDQDPICHDDPLLTELDAAGVPAEFVDLAWSVFVRDWGAKKAKDWPATFRNAIRKGWIRLWYFDQATGQCRLNSTGELARRSCGNE